MSKRGRLIVDRSTEVTERRLLETALVALNRCSTNETQDEAYYALRDAEERIYDQGRAPRVNGFSFLEALDLAQGAVDPIGSGADPNPLADYVASDVPLTRNQRQLFAHFVRTLPTSLPHGYRGKGTHSMAARNETRIAREVKAAQKAWCEQHPTRAGRPRQHVPIAVTNQIIRGLDPSGRHDAEVMRLLKNKSWLRVLTK
jgi:hypothetical protein